MKKMITLALAALLTLSVTGCKPGKYAKLRNESWAIVEIYDHLAGDYHKETFDHGLSCVVGESCEWKKGAQGLETLLKDRLLQIDTHFEGPTARLQVLRQALARTRQLTLEQSGLPEKEFHTDLEVEDVLARMERVTLR